MKKSNIIATAAMAVAGITTYLIRKRLCSRKGNNTQHSSAGNGRHVTNVFAKAKLAAH